MRSVHLYFYNIWQALATIAIGMKVTFKHLFTPAVTVQYPDVRLKLPERARNRLYVNIDDCIGCDQCSLACPVDCISIETIKATPDQDLGVTSTGQKKRLHVPRFDIDIAKWWTSFARHTIRFRPGAGAGPHHSAASRSAAVSP